MVLILALENQRRVPVQRASLREVLRLARERLGLGLGTRRVPVPVRGFSRGALAHVRALHPREMHHERRASRLARIRQETHADARTVEHRLDDGSHGRAAVRGEERARVKRRGRGSRRRRSLRGISRPHAHTASLRVALGEDQLLIRRAVAGGFDLGPTLGDVRERDVLVAEVHLTELAADRGYRVIDAESNAAAYECTAKRLARFEREGFVLGGVIAAALRRGIEEERDGERLGDEESEPAARGASRRAAKKKKKKVWLGERGSPNTRKSPAAARGSARSIEPKTKKTRRQTDGTATTCEV